jgi:uncharacterized protein YjdB
MRAVTPSVLLAALLACGGEGGPPSTQPVTPAGPVVTSVLIAPPAGPIEVGASLALVATVRDQAGNPMAGKTVAWSTSDANVATVQSSGTVTGVAAGNAIISASVEGKTGSTQLTVMATPVATVTLSPPSAPVVAGQPAAMIIAIADRNGNALAGRRVTWSSSNTVVATVDANGALAALSPGTTTITALCEGITATAAVVVTAPSGSAPPTIASISPTTLAPGATATVTGTNFVALGANAVTVAGVPVTVNAATTTELSITIPAAGMPCQSTQPVAVTISSVGGSATTKHPLAVAKARSMSVGDSFIVGAADDIACNELPADASYLVSVFNGNNVPTLTTRFDFRGSPGGAVASLTPLMEAPRPSMDVSTGERVRPAGSAAEEEHLSRLASDVALFQRLGAPRRSRGGPSFSRAGSGVPVPLFVGSTTTMKYHYSNCSATGFSNVTARVVYVGPNAVVLEDVASPLAGKIDAELIALAQEFETRSFPLLLNFGDPLAWDAQTDQNGRIDILFTPKVNSQSQNLLGFVAGCDLYPPSQDPAVAASNQAEVFYARAVTDTSPTSTTLNGRAQWKRQMPATMIHEAKHITSYAERISRAATQFEQVWLEEATAQIASEMYGRLIHGNGWRSDAPYNPTLWCEARPTTPDCGGGVIAMGNHFAFLANYLQNFEAKSMLGGTDDNDIYGSSWLFVRWALDTYGGPSERDFLRGLVQTASRIGTVNVEEMTGKPFPRLLAEFTLMLAADNLPSVRAPFVMPSWNLPDVFAGYAELGTLPPAPLAMRQSSGGSFAISSRNLRGGGAVLLRLGPGTPGATQLLDLRSTATTPLSTGSSVGLAVLRIQ